MKSLEYYKSEFDEIVNENNNSERDKKPVLMQSKSVSPNKVRALDLSKVKQSEKQLKQGSQLNSIGSFVKSNNISKSQMESK